MALGLHHLRYVVVIAEEGNVTRAAQRLRLSQPSLSAALRDVERQVGCDLFLRRPLGHGPVPVSDVAPATTALGWRADGHNPLVDAFVDIARSVRDAPPS